MPKKYPKLFGKIESDFSIKSILIYFFKWLFISLIIGSCIGTASAFFLKSLEWVTNFREANLWIIAFLPLCGLFVGYLYHYYGKEVESGNNLLIDTIHTPKNKIPFKMTPLVYLGTIATHFFGGSAGREGTALQMAGAIADQFSKPLKLTNQDRVTLIIAAVAAGFGSVFGTPLAGTFFAMEFYRVGGINLKAIMPAFMAAILADSVTKLWHVPHTHYIISIIPKITLLHIIYAIIAGICFGICAAIFSIMIHKSSMFFKSKITYAPLRPFIGGLLVAITVFVLGTSKYIGLGIPTIIHAFNETSSFYDFSFKMVFTIVTLSAGFKGGEVTPLFFIGATLGSALSLFIPLPTGLLAGMGFVAVFAGATNTPIACGIMALELFGIESGIYTTIACVVAYFTSGHTSIYSRQLIEVPKFLSWSKDKGKRIEDL